MIALWLVTGVISASSEAPAVVRRGDDGGYASFTGAARKAIYERQLASLEDALEQSPKPAKTRQKAVQIEQRLREITLTSPEPEFEELASTVSPFLDQFKAEEIDWTTLVALIGAQIEAERKALRKRRKRNIAIAMLMAA